MKEMLTDFNVPSAIIGGFIGFLSSLFMFLIQIVIDKKGKLYIYFRRANALENMGWGIKNGCFMIPMYIDYLNTTNVNKAVRDFSLYIYGSDKNVKKFIQASMSVNSENINNKDRTFGLVNNRYSFAIGPKSIVSAECLFMLKTSELRISDNYKRIVVRYYDENNHRHEYELSKFEYKGQSNCSFDVDKDWIRLN